MCQECEDQFILGKHADIITLVSIYNCQDIALKEVPTTSCKNVETLPWKNDLPCFKSLLVTSLWDIILTSLLPPIQRCSSKFWVWSCIASNFDNGWRGDHKYKIMDRPFMPKYGMYSVSSTFATGWSYSADCLLILYALQLEILGRDTVLLWVWIEVYFWQ